MWGVLRNRSIFFRRLAWFDGIGGGGGGASLLVIYLAFWLF